MKFIPFGPRALVRPFTEEVSNKSKIMMPETAKEKPVEGVILALGQTIAAVEMGERSGYAQHMPRTGDRVLFGKYAGAPIKIDGEDMLIMHIDELLGRIEGAEEKLEVDGLPPIKKKVSHGK